MIETANKTVRELAVQVPSATRVFEQLGIDYCCGGQKPLSEACEAARVPVEDVLQRLEDAERQSAARADSQDWSKSSLAEIVHHIVSTHHEYVKREVPRLEKLLEKVCAVHGGNHPELLQVQSTFHALGEELGSHLMKEEQILFPHIVHAERGEASASCFGSVSNPIRMMMFEHDSAGTALHEIRSGSRNFALPEDACISYRTLYEALQAFEADLHQHIHLENNILFPRTLELE
jgi:regulator of cell morphogenesis and NO signaling